MQNSIYRKTYQHKETKRNSATTLNTKRKLLDPNSRHHILKRVKNQNTVNNDSKDFRAAFSFPDFLILLQPRHYRV